MCGDGNGSQLSRRDRCVLLADHIGRSISLVVELAKCREVEHRGERLLYVMRVLKDILAKITILRRYQNRTFDPEEFQVILDAVIRQLPLL